jgi:DNA-3-methyladenine glycosylase II
MDLALLHPDFVRTARRVSRPLAQAMDAVGPPDWPSRHQQPLARYLARVVVGQQLSTRAASTIWGRVEALGKAEQQSIPALALNLPDATLLACGLSAGKLKTLKALAEADAAGVLKRQRLARLEPAARAIELTALRGIGPWTADMLALFYFRDPDIWPLGDLAVRKTLERFLVTQSRYDLSSAAALFAPHRSVLALYMWRIADNPPDR